MVVRSPFPSGGELPNEIKIKKEGVVEVVFDDKPKEDILLAKYPTYYLLGRIFQENVQEFLETWNEDLLLYKFCQNSRSYTPLDELNRYRKRKKFER